MAAKRISPKELFLNIFRVFVLLFQIVLLLVILYRVIPVPITPLMLLRPVEIQKKWIPLEKISKNVPLAAITSEDPHFIQHHGFDFKAIADALSDKFDKGKKLRGGSTISQQTAKNVFLWPDRSWLRNALEVPLTITIEAFWTKKRIIEVYLNIIEMGNGIYGIEAAAQKYYRKSAATLNRSEAALVVVCFPDPRRWTPAKPTAYIRKKQSRIIKWMNGFEPIPEWWYDNKPPAKAKK